MDATVSPPPILNAKKIMKLTYTYTDKDVVVLQANMLKTQNVDDEFSQSYQVHLSNNCNSANRKHLINPKNVPKPDMWSEDKSMTATSTESSSHGLYLIYIT